MTTGIERLGAELLARAAGSGAAPKGPEATSFERFLARELEDTVATLRQGEETAKRGVVGLAGTQEVVEAVTAAELALERIVAVRDRVISAYQEIMRMPI